MQGLSPTQKRALTPVCPPGLIRLATFMLVGGLVTLLLGRGMAVPEVLTLVGAVVVFTLALTISGAVDGAGTVAAVLTLVCAPAARLVLARAAVAS